MLTGSVTASVDRSAGSAFNWSRLNMVGGNHVVDGLSFVVKRYSPLMDPRVTWASGKVLVRTPVYWSGSGIAANTYVQSFTETTPAGLSLLPAGTVIADALAGHLVAGGAGPACSRRAQTLSSLAAQRQDCCCRA